MNINIFLDSLSEEEKSELVRLCIKRRIINIENKNPKIKYRRIPLSDSQLRKLISEKLRDDDGFCDLDVRIQNGMRGADIETFADLATLEKSNLLRIRNFGIKSFNELEDFLKSKGLNFGMDIGKYGLKKKVWNNNYDYNNHWHIGYLD